MGNNSAVKKPGRNLNIDLIRCFALLFVLFLHSIDNSPLYITRISGAGVAMMVVKMVVTMCIPLYIMITGYLCNGKRLTKKYYLGYVRIYLTYIICMIPSTMLECYFKHSYSSVKELIGSVINFNCNGYAWYLLMYSGLFLLIPFLNMMYRGCESKRQKQVLVLTFFALSILPSLLNTFFQIYSLWWKNLYPICYYFTGAYLYEYMPKQSPRKLALCFLSFLGAYSVIFFFYHHADGSKLTNVYQTTWQIYLLAVIAFCTLSRLDTDKLPGLIKKLIMKISDLTLFIYLLTWVSDGLLYMTMARLIPSFWDRYIWSLIAIPISFISSTLLALLMDKIYQPLYSYIMTRLTRLLKL